MSFSHVKDYHVKEHAKLQNNIMVLLSLQFIVFCSIFCRYFSSAAYNSETYVGYDSESKKFYFSAKYITDWIAFSNFRNTIFINGWSFLNVTTREKSTDEWQAYGAGLAEGHLTRELINMTHYNMLSDVCPKPYSSECKKLRNFFQKNLQWVLQQIYLNDESSYWHQVKLFLIQVAGISDGFYDTPRLPSMKLDPFGLWLFQMREDIDSISKSLGLMSLTKSYRLGEPESPIPGSCSALVRLLPDGSDVYISHDTWSTYNSMLRVIKRYNFPFHLPNDEVIPGRSVTFTSYPGTIHSIDDFYIMSTKLVTTETTIGNKNASLWKNVKPESVLEPIRVMTANRLSTSGSDWVKSFSKHNCGTYNNEWMVLNYNLFKPTTNPPIKHGFFTVLNQLPGYIKSADLTDLLLKEKYFGSFNIAYFPDVFNMSGNHADVLKYGDWLTHDGSPRAKIFKRDHVKVKDLASMIKIMRYNNFQDDPLSRCVCSPPYSAENAIAARSDLNPENGTYQLPFLGHRNHGATDMKVTTSKMVDNFAFIAQAGPTFDQQPPFQWSTTQFTVRGRHKGMPDLFKFSPVYVSW